MLPVPPVMSTNKILLTIKDRHPKQLQLDPRLSPIQAQNLENIYQSYRKDKVVAIKVPHMGKDVWPQFISDEVDKVDE